MMKINIQCGAVVTEFQPQNGSYRNHCFFCILLVFCVWSVFTFVQLSWDFPIPILKCKKDYVRSFI